MRRSHLLAPSLALALVTAACQPHAAGHRSERTDPAAVVWQEQQCGFERFTARPLDDQPALEAALSDIRARQLGGVGEGAPAVDFSTRRALLVALGQKPTPGYGIELDPPAFEITPDGARLQLTLVRPPTDRMQAQMLTSPCAVIALPRAGYARLVLQDQRGRTLDRLAVE